jgi:hypothetical protein
MLKWWRDILGMNLAHRTGPATGAYETGSALMTA